MGSYIEKDMRAAYLDAIFANVTTGRSLRVVVDAGNGITGAIAPQLVEELGCDVIPLHCEIDGRMHEMESSLLIMDFILQLKARFPDRDVLRLHGA